MKDKPRFMISILGLQKTIRWCSALGLPYFWIFLEGLNFTFSKISNGERTQMYGENPLLGRLGALYSSGGALFFFLLEHFAKCRISFGHRIPRKLFARRKYGFGMITGFIFCPDEHCRMLPHVAGAVDCFVCAVTDIFLSLRVTVQMFLVDGC